MIQLSARNEFSTRCASLLHLKFLNGIRKCTSIGEQGGIHRGGILHRNEEGAHPSYTACHPPLPLLFTPGTLLREFYVSGPFTSLVDFAFCPVSCFLQGLAWTRVAADAARCRFGVAPNRRPGRTHSWSRRQPHSHRCRCR
jgi:hypothetical protein